VPVVRDVPTTGVRDLLERPPRAAVAFVRDGEVEIVPVRARCERDAYAFDSDAPLDAREVVLLIDDGPYWFQLRGISVRGTARRLAPGRYALDPRRVDAWDYATIREEKP
jgi:hypothetical protein